MKPTAKDDHGEEQIERVRRICLALPETWEKISHGEPTWFVAKKVFAMFSNNHHNDGHIAVTVPAAIGIQEMLIKKSPKRSSPNFSYASMEAVSAIDRIAVRL